jgi:hypothetical protein
MLSHPYVGKPSVSSSFFFGLAGTKRSTECLLGRWTYRMAISAVPPLPVRAASTPQFRHQPPEEVARHTPPFARVLGSPLNSTAIPDNGGSSLPWRTSLPTSDKVDLPWNALRASVSHGRFRSRSPSEHSSTGQPSLGTPYS